MATRFSFVYPMDGTFLNVEIIEQDYGFFKTDTRNPFIPYRGQMLLGECEYEIGTTREFIKED
jgi:alpha-glucuronidase